MPATHSVVFFKINQVSMTSVVSAQGGPPVTLCPSLMLAQGGLLCVMVLPRPADPAGPTIMLCQGGPPATLCVMVLPRPADPAGPTIKLCLSLMLAHGCPVNLCLSLMLAQGGPVALRHDDDHCF